MSNTKQWVDPDTQITNTGPGVGGVYLVDPTTQKAISPSSSSGGPVTIADGADVTLGSKADASIINPAVSASVISLLKGNIQDLNSILVQLQDINVNTGGLPISTGQKTMANSTSVAIASDQSTIPFNQTSQYPSGATPQTASSGNVANAIATATLTGAAGKTTYITGFEITGSGATLGLPVTVTVTGTISGILSYTYSAIAGVLLANTPLIIEFNPPIPSSAVNTNIVVSCPALGAGNTNNTVVSHGYTL